MTRYEIKKWMLLNVDSFVDECGEINCTAMVEAWDRDTQNGGATIDPNHIAWTIAVEVVEKVKKQ